MKGRGRSLIFTPHDESRTSIRCTPWDVLATSPDAQWPVNACSRIGVTAEVSRAENRGQARDFHGTSTFWVAVAALLVVAVPQAWVVLSPSLATRVAATLCAVSVFSAIFARVIEAQQRRLVTLAVTDPLTGLANRALLRGTLEQAIQQKHRRGAPMTLVTLDLDHFNAINDTLGQDAGEAVLRGVGDLLNRRIRRADRVFRLGGEEFLALLCGTNAEVGQRVAEELRDAIGSLSLIPDRTVTVTVGIAALRPGEDGAEWMKRGDENLYRAKSAGRDRVAACRHVLTNRRSAARRRSRLSTGRAIARPATARRRVRWRRCPTPQHPGTRRRERAPRSYRQPGGAPSS